MRLESKRRKTRRNNKQVIILVLFVIFSYILFNLGKAKNEGGLNFCQHENLKLKEDLNKVQEESTEYQKSIETLKIKESLLQEKYDKLISSEKSLNLFNTINKKIDSGIDIARIQRSIDELKADRNCSTKAEKRFIVKTPLYKGDIKHTNVSFENNLFDITADGYSFINDNKKPESWFNDDKTIFVNFTTKNGIEVVKQKLPIKKSIILDNKEYFFEIIPASTRGFVIISEYHCNYP